MLVSTISSNIYVFFDCPSSALNLIVIYVSFYEEQSNVILNLDDLPPPFTATLLLF